MQIAPTTETTRCRPNGTQLYWPAVQCRPPDHPHAWPLARRQFTHQAAGWPARRQRYRRRRRQMTTTNEHRRQPEKNNTGPISGPVIILICVENCMPVAHIYGQCAVWISPPRLIPAAVFPVRTKLTLTTAYDSGVISV